MSNTEMEFLKGAGKAFEIVRTLANLVLARGGTEEHLLRILKPNSPEAVQIADILVGTRIVTGRSDENIVLDKGAPTSVRLRAFRRGGTVSLTTLLVENAHEYPPELTALAVKYVSRWRDTVKRDKLLLELSQKSYECAEEAVSCMTNQDDLVQVACFLGFRNCALIAVKKLDDVHLHAVLDRNIPPGSQVHEVALDLLSKHRKASG